jgi:hypothetical protein
LQGYKPDNMTHAGRRAPRVAIVHDAVKETIRAHRTLVHVFYAYASTDTPWVAHALSHSTLVRYGRIASILATYDTTQFVGSICFICASYKVISLKGVICTVACLCLGIKKVSFLELHEC